MHVQRPVFKYEFNLTTLVAMLGLLTAIWTASARYSGLENTVADLEQGAQVWRDGHMSYHRERAQEVAASNARIDERLKELEAEARQMDRMEYRLTVQEQGTTSLTAAVAELRQTINDQSGDIRLIREIVQRMEGGNQTP